MTKSYYETLNDRDLIGIIKNPKTPDNDYQRSCEVLLERYSKQLHKNWWVLQRQLNKLGNKTITREDYFDMAYEAFFVAIQKTDLDKVENDSWKFVGMLNWYLTNVRTKIIKEIKSKWSKTKSLVNVALKENDDSSVIDADVEMHYQESEGFKLNPEYEYEISYGYDNCERGVKKCLEKWSDTEKTIYRLLESGETKVGVARKLGVEPSKVYAITKKMSVDLKKELGYNS